VARAELSEQLFSAALLRRNAFLLDQEIARAGSRARMVYERNLKLLRASEDNPEKANAKKVAEHRSLIGQAVQYLAMLDQKLTDVQTLPTRWRAMARRCEDNVQTMLKQMSRAVEIEVTPVKAVEPSEFQEPKRSSAQHPMPSSRQPIDQKPATALPAEESNQIADIRRKIAQIHEEARNEKKAPPSERPPQPQRNPQKPPIMQRPPQFPRPGFDQGW
jgi:hypothetical protein